MPEKSRFFDATSYSEADQAEVQARYRRDGLIYEAGNRLAVSAPGGMFVRVASGEMMIQGFWYKNDADLDLAVTNNVTAFTRIDRLVLHLDRNGNNAHMIVLPGTPSGSPSAPGVTQTPGGDWEISFGTITVPAGTTTNVTGGMLTISIPISMSVINSLELGTGVVNQAAMGALSVGTPQLILNSVDGTILAPGAINNANKFAASVVDMTALAANAATKLTIGSPLSGSTSSTSPVNLNTMSVTTSGGPCILGFTGFAYNSTVANPSHFGWNVDGGGFVVICAFSSPGTGYYQTIAGLYAIVPNAGAHSFTLQYYAGAGTLTIGSGYPWVLELKR